MNFIVSRVSGSDALPPVDGAIQFNYLYETNVLLETRVGWTVNVHSLEELLALMAEVKHSLIVGPWYADKSKTEITIYDGYVE